MPKWRCKGKTPAELRDAPAAFLGAVCGPTAVLSRATLRTIVCCALTTSLFSVSPRAGQTFRLVLSPGNNTPALALKWGVDNVVTLALPLTTKGIREAFCDMLAEKLRE